MKHTHQTYNRQLGPGRGGNTAMCSQLAHNENASTEHLAARTRVHRDQKPKTTSDVSLIAI